MQRARLFPPERPAVRTQFALKLLSTSHWNEGKALAFLLEAESALELQPTTVQLLRAAIEHHFAPIADTLKNVSPAAEFAAAEREGEQAPSRPVTIYPQGASDMGFELDGEGPTDTMRSLPV